MFSAESLLNPISLDQPSGEDLAFSPDLDAIASARKADDPTLDQGEWITPLKEADWDFVVKRCAALLETKSKDLRLAAWLAEAGGKKYYMRGLAEGLLVVAGLLDRFWDKGLYPESNADEHEQRIGNLSMILNRIPVLLREMPVAEENGKRYSSLDFEVARKNPNHAELKLADMDAAKRASSDKFKSTFADDAKYLADALGELEVAANLRLGNEGPGFASARDAVQTMVHFMPAAAVASPKYLELGPELETPLIPAPVVAGPPGAINSRAQALAQLRAVAEFFRRTEPHSPVSYFADKAAKAGDQDLHAWLRSVVKDPASMAHIEELLGVRPPE